jgi:hypothetical protein
MKEDTVLDTAEKMLAYLICGESIETSSRYEKQKKVGELFEAYETCKFEPMIPNNVYISSGEDRLFTDHNELLLNTPQDILGNQAETALLGDGILKWSGYRKLNKRPKNIWVSCANASLYEWHYREIFMDGSESYGTRVVAFDKKGYPKTALVVGSSGNGANNDSVLAIMNASIIEDIYRPNALKATVKEDRSIIFSVPLGEHKELFALREAPLTPSGRKKAILHWVKNHNRKVDEININVQQHWRGTREIQIDGFNIKLEEPMP